MCVCYNRYSHSPPIIITHRTTANPCVCSKPKPSAMCTECVSVRAVPLIPINLYHRATYHFAVMMVVVEKKRVGKLVQKFIAPLNRAHTRTYTHAHTQRQRQTVRALRVKPIRAVGGFEPFPSRFDASAVPRWTDIILISNH